MMQHFVKNSVILLLFACLTSSMFAKESLIPQLEALRPFLGKTYKATMTKPGVKPVKVDISKWERHLNGNAVRIQHSINDGEYGGETLIYWDKEKKQLMSYYFTTAGFYTIAPIEIKGSSFTSREVVTGNQNGITEVQATGTLNKDGSMKMVSKYLQNGKWVEGQNLHYTVAKNAVVKFK